MFDLIAYLRNSFQVNGSRSRDRRFQGGRRRRRLWAERLEDRNLLSVAFGLGTAGQEYGKALTVDPSGDVLVAMLFQNTLDFDPGAGSAVTGTPPGIDLAVAKYRPDGSMSWVKTVSTLAPNAGALVVPHGVQTDAVGNVYVIGYFGFLGTNVAAVSADFDPGPGAVTLTNTGGADPFVAKLDPSGNLLWARTFGNSTASNTEERAWDLAVDASGSVYVAGFLNGTYDLNASPSSSQLYTSAGAKDAFLVKYDAAGNFVWGFGLGTAGDEEGLSVDVDDAGSVFFQGYFNNTLDLDPGPRTTNVTSAGSSDLFLARYDAATGVFQTGVRIGGTLAETSPPGTLRLDASGHVFLSGRFRGTVDLDPGPGTFNVSNLGTGVTDEILLANYTTDFAFRWGFSLPSDGGLDGAHRVDFDTAGNVYIAGWHSGTTDFDPGSGTFNLTSSNAATGAASDLFLAKYTSAGAFLWADQFGGPVSDQTLSSIVAGMAVDRNGNAYITGQTYGTTDFDPGSGTAKYVPVGLNDAFLAMYDPLGNLAENAAPTATPQTRSTNAGTPVDLTLGGDDGDPEVVQTLTYALAANPGHGTLSGFNSATGQVTYTPTAGFRGTDTFTFTVTDDVFAGGPSRTSPATTATINVVAANNPPTISDIGNQTTNEDTATNALAFTVGDVETPAASLTVTAASSNTTLVPNANIVLGGSGANRTLTMTPAANQSGAATITVTVSDGDKTATDTFVLTVAPGGLWQNPAWPCDVNDDGRVAPVDVLVLINYINRHPRDTSLPPASQAPPPFYDVNNDQRITPADVLTVINYLNAQRLMGEGEAALRLPLASVVQIPVISTVSGLPRNGEAEVMPGVPSTAAVPSAVRPVASRTEDGPEKGASVTDLDAVLDELAPDITAAWAR